MLGVEDARALITTSLSDESLEVVIQREEAWLARRIGPLDGLRVETFISVDGDEVLRLSRPATSVTVEDDSGDRTADTVVRTWSDVCLLPDSASWSGDVRVSYVPADESEVTSALITLLRLTLGESAYAQQQAGGYQTTVSYADQKAMRYTAWRSLLRPRLPQTTRLRSVIPYGGKELGPVDVESGS